MYNQKRRKTVHQPTEFNCQFWKHTFKCNHITWKTEAKQRKNNFFFTTSIRTRIFGTWPYATVCNHVKNKKLIVQILKVTYHISPNLKNTWKLSSTITNSKNKVDGSSQTTQTEKKKKRNKKKLKSKPYLQIIWEIHMDRIFFEHTHTHTQSRCVCGTSSHEHFPFKRKSLWFAEKRTIWMRNKSNENQSSSWFSFSFLCELNIFSFSISILWIDSVRPRNSIRKEWKEQKWDC